MLTHVSAPDADGRVTYTFNSQSKVEVPKRYKVSGLVGRGAYGIVCSATDSETGESVAIKKINNVFGDLVDGKRILRELKLLGFLKHPNIVSLKNVYRPFDQAFSDIYLVTELMSSDLQILLKSSSVVLSEVHCQYFTYQLLCALHYIHSANVIHRDLKPANILVNTNCELKLCDFGLARGKGSKMTQYVVTRWYRPPELLLACEHVDEAIDLWGVACLAVEMLTRRTLFPGRDYIHQLNLIIALLGLPDITHDFPHVCLPEALNYLRSLPPTERQPLEATCPGIEGQYRAAAICSMAGRDDGEAEGESAMEKSEEEKDTEGGGGGGGQRRANNEDDEIQARYALFKDFVFGLLKYNPAKRMTAKEALAHPWLRSVRASCDCDELQAEAVERFFWELDDVELSAAQLRELIMEEIMNYGECKQQ